MLTPAHDAQISIRGSKHEKRINVDIFGDRFGTSIQY